ncbi:hypothetical protein HDU88_006063 [Geranomyces variabilis]|nr:hypothetical protein HDU88_006063 [Geranomyces variabilis]
MATFHTSTAAASASKKKTWLNSKLAGLFASKGGGDKRKPSSPATPAPAPGPALAPLPSPSPSTAQVAVVLPNPPIISTPSQPSNPSPTDIYIIENAKTCPIPLRPLSQTTRIVPPVLDKSFFLPPPSMPLGRALSPILSSPRHTRSPSGPATPATAPDDLLLLGSAEMLELQALKHTRSKSICVPRAGGNDDAQQQQQHQQLSSSSVGNRLVHVSNKGRFQLTREQSDYYTARRPGHVRAKSHAATDTPSPSRFHVVRSMDRPIQVSAAAVALESPGSDDEQALKSGTLKSMDSGVAL